jgi:hypothetical protein
LHKDDLQYVADEDDEAADMELPPLLTLEEAVKEEEEMLKVLKNNNIFNFSIKLFYCVRLRYYLVIITVSNIADLELDGNTGQKTSNLRLLNCKHQHHLRFII